MAGYAWGELPEGSLVVDVGGGVGSQTLLLALHHPHLRFIVQDRESVVGDAVEVSVFNPLTSPGMFLILTYTEPQYWKKNMPSAVESGRVKLQGSSVFTSTFSGLTQLTFGSPRPRLLQATACAARGRLSLHPRQSAP